MHDMYRIAFLSIPAGKLSGNQRHVIVEDVKGMTKVTGTDSQLIIGVIISNRQLNACALLVT